MSKNSFSNVPPHSSAVVVKCQKPLIGPQDHFLVYDQERKNVQQVEPNPRLERLMYGRLKEYLWAAWTDRGWDIITRAPRQTW